MRTLTDKQYEEYKNLKRWAKREKVWVSAKGIEYLEDDVDTPIKKCVAMLALLGLEPLFSCCGFDYQGQPYHKAHQYGHPYIMVSKNAVSSKWLLSGGNGNLGWGWRIRKHLPNALILELPIKGNPHWRKRDCIHFSEEVVLGISYLERGLLGLSDSFQSTVILLDTNQNYKKNGIRYWQYPPKKPWVIQKELIDTY